MRSASLALSLVALTVALPSLADPYAPDSASWDGFGVEVEYCDDWGLWNDGSSATAGGLEWHGIEVSMPGNPWQQLSVSYNGVEYGANGNLCTSGYTSSQTNPDTLTNATYGPFSPSTFSVIGGYSDENGSTTVWMAGDLRITKHEYWGEVDGTKSAAQPRRLRLKVMCFWGL